MPPADDFKVPAPVSVIAMPRPFTPGHSRLELPEGATLAEMVAAAGISGARLAATHVEIGGHVIPRAHWHRVRPRAGMLVTVRVLPLGGGGGSKVTRSLLMIAVIAVAAWLGGPAGGALATEFGIAKEVATAIAVTVMTTVGSVLVNALVPLSQPKLSTATGDSVQTYGISDLRNVADPWGTIPKVYGRMRVWPKRAAKVVTEVVGDDQYLRVLLCVGHGPLKISEIKIGETPIADFDDVELEVREGYQDDAPVTLYTTDINEEALSILVTKEGGPIARTAGPGADELSVDLTWRALIAQNDKGDQLTRQVNAKIEYRAVGATEWLPVPQSGDATPATTVTTIGNYSSRREWRTDLPIAGPVTLNGLSAAGAARLKVYTRPSGSTSWAMQRDMAMADVPAALTLAGIEGKALEVAVEAVAADPHDTPIVIAPTSWSYLARQGTDGVWQVRGKTWNPLRRSIRWRVPVRGQYEIRVTRLTDDTDSARISDEMYWSAIRTVTDRPPVSRKGLALIAARIRATEQLNGVVDTLNCIAQAVLPEWDAATGTWVTRETRSPAAAIRDVFQGAGQKRAVSDNRLDLPGIEDFAEWCAPIDPETGQPRFTFDAVYDAPSTGWEVLRQIAAAGRAVPWVRGGRYTVVIDRPQPGPVALVTPRNAWGYSSSRALIDLPHALRVRFLNADKGYEQDELIVCRDGYTVDPDIPGIPATLLEDIEFPGVVTRRQNWILARRAMAEAILRPEVHSVWQDVEALGYDRGDQIAMAYDVPRIGLVSGRITGVIEDDQDRIVGVELDEPVGMEDGRHYAMRIRLGGTTRQIVPTVETVPGETRIVTFFLPLEGADRPAVGDLYAFGESERETVQLIVRSLEYGPNLSVRLTMVDAAPAVHTAEDAPIPAYDPLITLDPEVVAPGAVVDLQLAEIARPGEARTSLRASWQPPSRGFAGGYEIYAREGLGLRWRMIGATAATSWTVTEQARPGETYEVLVLAVGPSGARAPLRQAATAQITAAGDPIYPRPPVAVTPRPGIGQIIVEITPADDPRAVEHEVRAGVVDDVDQAEYAGRVRGTVITIPDVPADAGRYLWVRAIDAFGRPGPWAQPGVPSIPEVPGGAPGAENPWPGVPGIPAYARPVLEADLGAEVSGRLDLIDRSMVGDAAGGLMQRVETASLRAGERAAEADREIRAALERLATAQVDAALRTVDTRGLVRDAGIEVDPSDGRVKIRAVEALATDTTRRLSEVSADLDAQAAAIELRATRSELVELEGETATRFGAAEARLDAAEGAIDLRATRGELAALGAELLEQIQPAARWEYHDSAEGWAATAGTLTAGAGVVTLTGAAPARMAVSGLAIDGAAAWIVAIRLRRVAGTGWGVRVGWSTAAGSDEVAVTAPADPAAWSVVQAVLRGRASWDGQTVQGLAVSAGEAAGDGFEVDFVEVARSGAQALILDGLEGRLGSTEARLDAAEGAIALKADLLTVADQAARLGNAEARLDAAEGAIDLRATVSDLAAAQTRIGSAEARLDGAEAAIALKADQTVVTAQGQEIAEVAAELDAVDGRISLVVSDVIERVDGAGDAAALAALAGALGHAEAGAVRRAEAAMVRQDLTARVDEATGAVARSVELLAVRVADTAAEVASETIARATADDALASEVTGLRARVGVTEDDVAAATAAIASETTVRAAADLALAEDLATLTAELGAASAAITDEAEARAAADAAMASQVTGLTARVDGAEGRIGAAEAAITSAEQAIAEADAASARSRDQLIAYVDAGDADGAATADQVAAALLASVIDGADAAAARREDGAAIRRDVIARVEAGELSEAAAREALAVRLGTAEAGIVSEQLARATGDAALAADLSSLTARMGAAEAGITGEAQARADADGALAAQVTSLTARAGAADDAIADVSAAVTGEAQARATADAALAADITRLTADLGAASAAVTAEAQARADADTALAGQVTGLTARVDGAEGRIGAAEAAITSAEQAIAEADVARASTRDQLIAYVDAGDTAGAATADQVAAALLASVIDGADAAAARREDGAAIRRDVIARVEAGELSEAVAREALAARLGSAEAGIVSEQLARATGDAALAADLSSLTARMGAAEAGITDEAQARADADGALAAQVTSLTADLGAASAAIADEAQVRASEDDALAGLITSLDADVQGVAAAIEAEAQARAAADAAEASARQALAARVEVVEGAAGADEQRFAVLEAAVSDEAIARADGDAAEAAARQVLAAQVAGLGGDIGDVAAAVTAEAAARADADAAAAERIDGLTARVDGAEGRIGAAEAAITSAEQAIAEADAASARSRDQLIAYVDAGDAAGAATADQVAAALLASVIDGADAAAARREDGAAIRRDVVARVEAGELSEAAAREALAVRLSTAEAGILSERVARATGDAALAADLSSLTARMGAAEAGITSEAQARADADGALAAQVVTLSAGLADAGAAMSAETAARVDADAALTSAVTGLTSRMGAAEAGIEDERTTRAAADQALSTDLTSITARVATVEGGIDAAGGRIDAAEAAITANAAALAAAETAIASRQDQLVAYVAEDADRQDADADQVAAALLASVLGQAEAAAVRRDDAALIRRDVVARVEAGERAEAAGREVLAVRLAGAEAAVAAERVARIDGLGALASEVAAVGVRVGAAEAAVTSEAQARADGDAGLAAQLSTLSTRIGTAEAGLTVERDARATADAAEAASREALAARVGAAEGDIIAVAAAVDVERDARAEADAAEASARDALSARVDGLDGEVSDARAAITAEAQARADADGALGTRIDAVEAAAGANAAAIEAEQSARVDALTAEASAREALTVRVAEAEAGITTTSSALAGLDGLVRASWGVTVDVGGRVSGVSLNGSSTGGSEFEVVADRFKVSAPGAAALAPFEVVGGVVRMREAAIGTLGFDRIRPDSVQILTDQLAIGAASETAAVDQPETVSIDTNALSTLTASSLSLTTAGEKVLIIWSAYVHAVPTGGVVRLRLRRVGDPDVVLRDIQMRPTEQVPLNPPSAGGNYNPGPAQPEVIQVVCVQAVDQPPAGAHSYTVTLTGYGYLSANQRTLTVQRLKTER